MSLLRAAVESYDPLAHTANVRPLAHPASLLVDVPVLGNCAGDLLVEGATVLVQLWDDAGAVVLGPFGNGAP
ncbi:MAG: hypothetical protein U9R48_09900 [Chloroflexota bacterium]|nr:hypothetical protein [Chloroflexota bacterium]